MYKPIMLKLNGLDKAYLIEILEDIKNENCKTFYSTFCN